MFCKSFAIVASLIVVKSASISAIMSRENLAGIIHGYPECISTSLRKDLILASLGMISPNRLAKCLDGQFGRAIVLDGSGYRAPLCRIEPSVGTHAQTIHNGVCVFKSEAFQMHFRGTVRFGITIFVLKEKQVRWIEYPSTFGCWHDRGCNVQSIDEG